jgi:hypothetical protein
MHTRNPVTVVESMDELNNFDFDDEQDLMDYINSLPEEQKNKLHELLGSLISELHATTTTDKDVVFCGSNGEKVIKCISTGLAGLGENGPVILPSSNETVILFAVANEYLEQEVDSLRNVYTDPELLEQEWQKFLDDLACRAAELHENMETPVWEDLLV